MGQQQLLIIVMAFIIVGMAVVAGLAIFADNAIDRNRDAVLSDLMHLTARAHAYYKRPRIFGGGEGSFVGLTTDLQGMKKLVNTQAYPWVSDNGRYRIAVAGTKESVVLRGYGNELGRDPSLSVAVTIAVYADSIAIVTVGGPLVAN
jgi:hypothetical protein